MFEDCPPVHLAPMQLPERTLVRTRLADRDGCAAVDAAFAAALGALRQHGTPYQLAHGLLGHTRLPKPSRGTKAAETVIGEARDIARRLRCQPLPDRAADRMPAELRIGP